MLDSLAVVSSPPRILTGSLYLKVWVFIIKNVELGSREQVKHGNQPVPNTPYTTSYSIILSDPFWFEFLQHSWA